MREDRKDVQKVYFIYKREERRNRTRTRKLYNSAYKRFFNIFIKFRTDTHTHIFSHIAQEERK